ncbi:hypothetical protein [Salibacterium aidingense]|uniref:hypothetical protein n=1 Tax=Salibacterium aidingense TaxID=384933 RepID=UPI00047CCBED|nr:hypothetical protein [Salibacterium aidingense]
MKDRAPGVLPGAFLIADKTFLIAGWNFLIKLMVFSSVHSICLLSQLIFLLSEPIFFLFRLKSFKRWREKKQQILHFFSILFMIWKFMLLLSGTVWLLMMVHAMNNLLMVTFLRVLPNPERPGMMPPTEDIIMVFVMFLTATVVLFVMVFFAFYKLGKQIQESRKRI